jgi:hypothetical protein
MAKKTRKIEIFSAGCSLCEGVIRQVKDAACPSCDVQVLDMVLPDAQRIADQLGVRSVPAVAIDGKLMDCCAKGGVDLAVLSRAGLGRPLA